MSSLEKSHQAITVTMLTMSRAGRRHAMITSGSYSDRDSVVVAEAQQ